jgi:hypothetical protein
MINSRNIEGCRFFCFLGFFLVVLVFWQSDNAHFSKFSLVDKKRKQPKFPQLHYLEIIIFNILLYSVCFFPSAM